MPSWPGHQMQNKLIIKGSNATKKIQLHQELSDLRKTLDRIEKEIHGQDVTDTVKTLIKRSLKMASGNLEGCLVYKKLSDQDKRR